MAADFDIKKKQERALAKARAPRKQLSYEAQQGASAGMPLFLQRAKDQAESHQASDVHEQQAERVAEQVTAYARAPQKITAAEKNARPRSKSQMNTAPAGAATASPITQNIGAGEPLAPSMNAYFTELLGQDFSHVRLHTGARARASARAINAQAYTAGRDVVFGEESYSPESMEGKRLLAHELTHVAQQRSGASAPAIQRRVGGDVTRMSITSDFARALTDLELEAQIRILRDHLRTLQQNTPEYDVALANLGLLETEARRRNIEPNAAGGGASSQRSSPLTIPLNVNFTLIPVSDLGLASPTVALAGMGPTLSPGASPSASSFDVGPNLGRSTAIGGAQGLSFMLSPPIRGGYDPFLPLFMRLGGGRGTLGPLETGAVGLERYIYNVSELQPRFVTEAPYISRLQAMRRMWSSSGQMPMTGLSPELRQAAKWLDNYGWTASDLERVPGLVSKFSQGGEAALSAAELDFLRTFFRAHAEEGMVFASPAISASMRPGLSSMEGVAPVIGQRSYIVRVEVPASAAGEVNAVLPSRATPALASEMEVLVTADARGAVTNIRPNPASSLGRAAPYLRGAGILLLVVGAGITAERVATATEQERPRVIGEEAGGWGGGFAGSSLAAAGCIAFGIVTEGLGLLLCGLGGGLLGGVGGSYIGGEIGESAGR